MIFSRIARPLIKYLKQFSSWNVFKPNGIFVSLCCRFLSALDLKRLSLMRFQQRRQEIWLAKGIFWVSDTVANKSPVFILEEQRFRWSPSHLKHALWGRLTSADKTQLGINRHVLKDIPQIHFTFSLNVQSNRSCPENKMSEQNGKATLMQQKQIQWSVYTQHRLILVALKSTVISCACEINMFYYCN